MSESFFIRAIDLLCEEDVLLSFEIMKQLRTHLPFETYQQYLTQMQKEGYELWAYHHDGKILGLMSTRIYTDLVRGPHLYIDDLVVDQEQRSKGIGQKLLYYGEELTRKLGLTTLRLCTGLDNEEGKRFYNREGWTERAYAFVKKI
jgi:ribosomal protein S18 acetylase RimI-like enzyme